MNKFKIVRRGPKWCVRVQGIVNTDMTWHWCRERNMEYDLKQHRPSAWWHEQYSEWDYDFIFDKEYKTTMFLLGCPHINILETEGTIV